MAKLVVDPGTFPSDQDKALFLSSLQSFRWQAYALHAPGVDPVGMQAEWDRLMGSATSLADLQSKIEARNIPDAPYRIELRRR